MANERKFVVENIRRVLLREYLMKETERAGFGGLDIQRTPIGTRISLFIERPGLVIGRQGGAIKRLTETLEKEFKFDNPQIEVQEVDNPSLNAQIMAEKLAVALERGWHFRRAGHSTVRRIMDSGARGCQVVISGKLTGQRHRTEKFKEGHIKHCGEPSKKFMRDGFAVAKLKLGIIGVKVQIMDSDTKLPDDIEVESALGALAEVEEGMEEAAVAAEEGPVEAEAPLVEAAAEVKEEAPAVEPKAEPEAAAATVEAPSEEPKVEAQPVVAEAEMPKPEEPEKLGKPTPLVEEKKEKEEAKKKERKVRDGKDLKTKKLKMVARKLEKLGEDVDVDLRVDEEEESK